MRLHTYFRSSAAYRVRVRALALAVACDIHPLNNTRVLQYPEHTLKLDRELPAFVRAAPENQPDAA